jgi:hypothetical protein
VFKEESSRITICLNKSSMDFFKKKAREHRTSNQKMIRRLIDWYVSQQQKSAQAGITNLRLVKWVPVRGTEAAGAEERDPSYALAAALSG